MRLIVLLLLASAIGFGLLYPMVNAQRSCYVKGKDATDNINSHIYSRGWNDREVCEARMDVLFSLETCIQESTKSSDIALYTSGLIQKLVYIFRPSTIGITDQKSDHNIQCESYYWTQLP